MLQFSVYFALMRIVVILVLTDSLITRRVRRMNCSLSCFRRLFGMLSLGINEALMWGHVIANLVHLAVHDPPLGFLFRFLDGESWSLGATLRGSEVGSGEAELVGGGTEALG